jgi:hypothetical protein
MKSRDNQIYNMKILNPKPYEICRAAGDRQAFSNPNPIPPEQSASNNPKVHLDVPPPPPPPVDLVIVLDGQNRILEFLANSMVN